MNQSIILVVLLFATVNSQFQYNRELYTYPCTTGGPAPALYTSFSPCYDTPGCQLPYCCGGVVDQVINLAVQYIAKENVTGGSVQIGFTGVTLTTPDNDPLRLLVPVTLPTLLMEDLVKMYPDMCYEGPNSSFRADFCPQTAGKQYTFKSLAQWSPLVNTAVLSILLAININPLKFDP